MSTLTFADTHNMVAFLEKPTESDGFHDIINFLNANQIHYALTVNPTIYTSCIKQFWATAKANTINGERMMQSKQGEDANWFMKTHGRLDDAQMYEKDDFHEDECCPYNSITTTANEGVTAVKIDEITPTSAPTIVIDELTLAQTHIEIKAAKPKAVTTTATTTTTRPKARGVVVQEPSELRTTTSSLQASQPSKTKDKDKAIMIELEVPLKRKDQVALDEEMARNLKAQLQAELIEEEKMARKKE
ncbi:hypothetical protein Tco_0697465 [Tanacetum coccineum]